jgi:ATP-dependent helicase/nuclease subunit A
VTALTDADARRDIRERLDRTLFVEAGAGSGKTHSLVERIVATVLDATDPVPLRHIAAVTFTEKAAAELRDRLRTAFEQRAAAEALDDLDSAAIGTLHSFAQRLLAEHPLQAGLPPLVGVLDEVASGVTFDERWAALRAELLDEPDLVTALPMALAAGMRLTDLRSMATAFAANWDLIADRILDAPAADLPPLDTGPLLAEARRLAAHADHCTDNADKFLGRLTDLTAWADRITAAPDDPARLAIVGEACRLKWGYGKKGNWTCDLQTLKDGCTALAAEATAIHRRVLDAALRRIARVIGRATLQAAEARRDEGRLEFHDLLVMARDLLTHPDHGRTVRAALRQRYRRILLDEFQDTDPIQIELAVRIAGGADATAAHWSDVDVPDGSLFVVGDPKQSIYRFRRADIATYLDAQEHVGQDVVLDTNFRTAAPVLDWINHTFDRLIVATPGCQPPYRPLNAHRPAAPHGPAVLTLGADPHTDPVNASDLRHREAADVAAAVGRMLADKWQVDNGSGGWRDVELNDIAVLIPSRTSLPHLEAALDNAGIGYQAEASSLVYRTREIRDLLTAAHAADDPSDPLALVAALRTPLFGCGDDDLWTWRQAGGRFKLLAPPPDGIATDHPVADAIAYLKRLHRDRTWLSPSEVLTRLVGDRRMLETAVNHPRTRDVWRRLRFVIDQARAWADTERGSLRGYLTWARRQGSESARAAEAVLPETDTTSLRILTIHAAKGLEFPIVILTGSSSRPGGPQSGIDVLWPRDGGCEFKLRKDLQTEQFDDAKPIDEQMSHHERLRLLYVGCTRARDHLVVSLHRKARPPDRPVDDRNLLAGASTGAPHTESFVAVESVPRLTADVTPVADAPPYDRWHATVTATRAKTRRAAAVSASHLEGTATTRPRPAATDPLGEPTDPGLAKQPRDLELPPWNKGRYGTAIGRAVHGVLQTVDLATGAGIDDAVAAQTLAEGVTDHTDLVTTLAQAALDADIVKHAATRPHWRETYTGTLIGDRVLEGIIDLLYRDDHGLVIVDYKTDAVPVAALAHRIDYYRPQLAAYALAVEAAAGEAVADCRLLFLTPYGAIDRAVDRLPEAIGYVREAVRSR